MQDWVGLLIAFVLGFFMKSLMGTVCQSRLVEGDTDIPDCVHGKDYYTQNIYGQCPGKNQFKCLNSGLPGWCQNIDDSEK